jgi:hypothetical protein
LDRSPSCCISDGLVEGPDSAELVVEMQRRQLDGDVGNGGGIGREASFEASKIGQSAGIQFGLDGLGEFGLGLGALYAAWSTNIVSSLCGKLGCPRKDRPNFTSFEAR